VFTKIFFELIIYFALKFGAGRFEKCYLQMSCNRSWQLCICPTPSLGSPVGFPWSSFEC